MSKQGKQLARVLSSVLLGTVLLASLILTSNYVQAEEGNQVFFRGGAVFGTSDRAGEVFTDVFNGLGAGPAQTDSDSGYYVGAGVELQMTKDVWGLLSGTEVLGEIGIEYRRFNSNSVLEAVPTTAQTAVNAATNPAGTEGVVPVINEVAITMLTVSVAPKIKFLEGNRFRPWIIPVGLDFNAISPPSNSTTVLDIGAQFGVGAEYRVWKAFNIGVDGRYHTTSGQTGVTADYGTIGAYVGIVF